jgi:hypothetical protein
LNYESNRNLFAPHFTVNALRDRQYKLILLQQIPICGIANPIPKQFWQFSGIDYCHGKPRAFQVAVRIELAPTVSVRYNLPANFSVPSAHFDQTSSREFNHAIATTYYQDVLGIVRRRDRRQ